MSTQCATVRMSANTSVLRTMVGSAHSSARRGVQQMREVNPEVSAVLDRTCVALAVDSAGLRTPVAVTLRYSPSDPFAVTVVFHGAAHTGDVAWTFSRDLLEAGLAGRAGLGDVRLAPTKGEDWVVLTASSADGTGTSLISWDDVASFLDAASEAVPAGAEQVDWDAFVRDVLTSRS